MMKVGAIKMTWPPFCGQNFTDLRCFNQNSILKVIKRARTSVLCVSSGKQSFYADKTVIKYVSTWAARGTECVKKLELKRPVRIFLARRRHAVNVNCLTIFNNPLPPQTLFIKMKSRVWIIVGKWILEQFLLPKKMIKWNTSSEDVHYDSNVIPIFFTVWNNQLK